MGLAYCLSHEAIHGWYLAWNRRDWPAMESLLSDQIECEQVALARCYSGKQDYLRHLQSWAEAFPDGVLRIDRISGSGAHGQVVVVEYRISGTQEGQFENFHPADRKVVLRFCDLLRFENQQLVQVRTYADLYRPLVELGHLSSRIQKHVA